MTVVGILVSAGLGAIAGVAAPVRLGGMAMIALSITLAFVMPETGFKPRPRGERNPLQAMTRTLRDGFRIVLARPVLAGLIGAGFVHGAFSKTRKLLLP